MVAQNMPKDIVFLSILLRLARRFRWSFLEPLYNAVEGVADDFSAEQWNDLVTRYNECLENLESILRQANMRELETVGDVKTATNISDDLLLKEMFRDGKPSKTDWRREYRKNRQVMCGRRWSLG